MKATILQPQNIRDKAQRKYSSFLEEWFDGKDSFPWSIPCGTSSLSGFDPVELKRQIRCLEENARKEEECGYDIVWDTRKFRIYGENRFPKNVVVKTAEDFLFLTKKTKEFHVIQQAAAKIMTVFPKLKGWLRNHLRQLPEFSESIAGLLDVAKYFINHPNPDCFVREIPVCQDTKFIQRHEKILREWLDCLLPANAIDVEETRFESRFGLRYDEEMYQVRLLDPSLEAEMRFPCSLIALPRHSLVRLSPLNVRILIAENKMNFLTAPPMKRTVALGGLGNGIGVLKKAEWIKRLPVFYWGDMDVEGFKILSMFRVTFPNVKSLLMNVHILQKYSSFTVPGNGETGDVPLFLTDEERECFLYCRNKNVRLEQERIPTRELQAIFENIETSQNIV